MYKHTNHLYDNVDCIYNPEELVPNLFSGDDRIIEKRKTTNKTPKG